MNRSKTLQRTFPAAVSMFKTFSFSDKVHLIPGSLLGQGTEARHERAAGIELTPYNDGSNPFPIVNFLYAYTETSTLKAIV